jgi:hypothetical protein
VAVPSINATVRQSLEIICSRKIMIFPVFVIPRRDMSDFFFEVSRATLHDALDHMQKKVRLSELSFKSYGSGTVIPETGTKNP